MFESTFYDTWLYFYRYRLNRRVLAGASDDAFSNIGSGVFCAGFRKVSSMAYGTAYVQGECGARNKRKGHDEKKEV